MPKLDFPRVVPHRNSILLRIVLQKISMLCFFFLLSASFSEAAAQSAGTSGDALPLPTYATAQSDDELRATSGFVSIGQERLIQERTAMLILLGWGLSSLTAGTTFAAAGNKSYRDFAVMNAGWGAVNAGIAAFALAGADTYTAATGFETILRDEQFFNRILAVNSGLNVAYISVGFSMNYLGQSSRIRQFGAAVMLQGAFLMAFDACLLWNSSDRLSRLAVYPTQMQLSAQDTGWTETVAYGLGLSIGF